MTRPYVGITGIVTTLDVETVSQCLKKMAGLDSHRFMAGVLASSKTMAGGFTPNRRYPMAVDVGPLLRELDSAGAWPVLHYNTRATGSDFKRELFGLARSLPSMRGIQLNVIRPNPEVIREFAREYPRVEVILQANRTSLAGTTLDAYAKTYEGIAHVLFDLSGGAGKELPVDAADHVLKALPGLRERGVGLGVAGGLGPDCGPVLDGLRSNLGSVSLRELSYDSESRVRVPIYGAAEGAKYQDRLDLNLSLGYVQAIHEALSKESP